MKKLALPVTGTYTVKDKTYTCGTTPNDCLVTLDIGRGSFNYGVAYYWGFLQTVLPDGRRFALSLGDGLNSEYHNFDKS